jgi:hypothetical protein
VKQVGNGTQFRVYQPTDRTGTIRLDTDNATLQKANYGYGYGKTRAIVGGQGRGHRAHVYRGRVIDGRVDLVAPCRGVRGSASGVGFDAS